MTRRSPWDPSHAPYGFADQKGSPEDWAWAFRQRFGPAQVAEILGSDDPWDVLGIRPGSSQAAIKAAYYRRSKATHPDIHPELDRSHFQRVQAAYEALRT